MQAGLHIADLCSSAMTVNFFPSHCGRAITQMEEPIFFECRNPRKYILLFGDRGCRFGTGFHIADLCSSAMTVNFFPSHCSRAITQMENVFSSRAAIPENTSYFSG